MENFVHRLELIYHVIYYFYILDMLDSVHEFQAIDEYMANKINDHIMIEQHHELFQDKSKKITRRFSIENKCKLTLHSKPESFSLADEDFL